MIKGGYNEIQIVMKIKIIFSLEIEGYFFNPIKIYSDMLVND